MEPGALLGALRKGRPGYAAVDVYEQEPVTDGDHPFLSMPNVLCTPHLGWAEWTNFELYFREAFEQIVAYEQGRPMRLGNPDVKRRSRVECAGRPPARRYIGHTAPVLIHASSSAPNSFCVPGAGSRPNPGAQAQPTSESWPCA